MFIYSTLLIIGAAFAFSLPPHIIDKELRQLAEEYEYRTPPQPSNIETTLVRMTFVNTRTFCANSFYHSLLDICIELEDGNVNPSILGICYPLPTPIYADGIYMAIELDERLKGSPLLLEKVLWHELGHCIHGLGHDEANYIMMSEASNPFSRAHLEMQKHLYIKYLKKELKK